jgi:hypothetical protein
MQKKPKVEQRVEVETLVQSLAGLGAVRAADVALATRKNDGWKVVSETVCVVKNDSTQRDELTRILRMERTAGAGVPLLKESNALLQAYEALRNTGAEVVYRNPPFTAPRKVVSGAVVGAVRTPLPGKFGKRAPMPEREARKGVDEVSYVEALADGRFSVEELAMIGNRAAFAAGLNAVKFQRQSSAWGEWSGLVCRTLPALGS